MKKYFLLFLSAFVICPCPIHGTILGFSLAGGTFGAKKIKEKCLDKKCKKC